ncbi:MULTISPECIES: tRNA glutamyl-Q(34) synthetase GluQRS [unclassified Thioalkalivibrio]|uniref:tRNA glutamyl-Q(34) synthetase GluQRS n=2 Tax=Thioalkalivibrio TaxID=106633 RepID=UPI0003801E8C|nr:MULTISPECIES: tRNA glutamyl-Q(34) synthetase GluQRS [unclassified Thioalkalivibrio]
MTTASSNQGAPYVGRFAPTPSGPLHAGSLFAAVISWLDARSHHGRWHLRIDDIDTPRVQTGAESAILSALEAFALDWDGPPTRQSNRTPTYQAALEHLLARDLAFGCACTRRDLAHNGKPGWEGPIYPGTCRQGPPAGHPPRAFRARAAQSHWDVEDRFLGPVAFDLEALGSDFVIRRADGLFAYQLATVVDDLGLGVTDVVRGVDLLGSTPRQMQLYQSLTTPWPRYAHHPVLIGAGGQKLSKAAGAEGLREDTTRAQLASVLTCIGLAPSDPDCPDRPAAQLAEALERLTDRPLATRLPLTTGVPVREPGKH